jgi:hypothetical protein
MARPIYECKDCGGERFEFKGGWWCPDCRSKRNPLQVALEAVNMHGVLRKPEPEGLDEFLESRTAQLDTPDTSKKEPLRPRNAPLRQVAPIERVIWKGTVWQFGELVEAAFRSGYLSAGSFADALKQICDAFAQQDGTPMNPRSVQQGLNQHREGQRSQKPKPIHY